MLIEFNNNFKNSNIKFTSRCKPIQTARTACGKISLYSTTKKQPLISRLRTTNAEVMEFFEDIRYNYSSFERKGSKIINILTAFLDCSERLYTNRKTSQKTLNYESAKDMLNYIRSEHYGNCGESAESIALILKMNGIKYTSVATLKSGNKEIDHEICLFNRDGSKFDGTIKNNQTIIVDAWSGIIDFANNALKDIKSSCAKQFYIRDGQNLAIDTNHIADFNLNNEELNILKKCFPEFLL